MTLSQEQFELIEAYLANELSAADAQAFEQEIAADAALQAEIETQRTFRMGLHALAIEQRLQLARQRVRQAEKEVVQATPDRLEAPGKPFPARNRTLSWGYWAAAASIVLGLGIGVYWYQHQQQAPELAYADTATADQLTKSLPADIRPADRQRIMNAIRGYKAGRYDEVIEQLKIPAADQRTGYYQSYFLGLSYLSANKPAKAIRPLTESLGTLSVPLRQKANWFLALSYLKNKEKEKALPILEKIRTDKAHPYHELAERIYAKVN
ncbi:hypothetical protein [uncultured Fibrella sp.]|uniref:hypothetical protein n=1 Tax=uncultured Fibrella sp. TaxID=1284596 RepID=UPI0035CC92DC